MTATLPGCPAVAHTAERADADPCSGLFLAHFDGLVRFAALMGADDPQDVAQEAFARLHQRMPGLRDDAAALPYLRTVAANLSRSRLRHLRVARAAALPDPGQAASAEAVAVGRDDQRRVVAALGRLTRRQREVVVHRYWLDMSIAQTAAALGIPPNTVKSTAARALKKLAIDMEDPS